MLPVTRRLRDAAVQDPVAQLVHTGGPGVGDHRRHEQMLVPGLGSVDADGDTVEDLWHGQGTEEIGGRRGAGVPNCPWRNSAAPARKALRQWQTRNDKRMLAVMTADRPGTMLNDVRTSNQA
jgi:hypothetical protein